MVKVYYDTDVSLNPLKDKTIGVIGYGSQGHAQAQTMRDSGLNVVLGLRPEGKSWNRAKKDGFEVCSVSDAAEKSDIVHMLIPDLEQPAVYRDYIESHLTPGKALGFAHGFNIHFKQIVPPPHIDVVMIAPKSPGFKLRDMYLNGFGVPALIAVFQDYSGQGKKNCFGHGQEPWMHQSWCPGNNVQGRDRERPCWRTNCAHRWTN